MMGPDVERILAGINAVKDTTTICISQLAESMSYQIISKAEHAGTAFGLCEPEEKEKSISASGFVTPIRSAMSGISADYSKMDSLNSGLYVSSSSFNNGYGSPWTELTKLNESITVAEAFASAHSSMNWLSEKAALLGLLNTILSLSVDVKWALITYHDYIQRGYDNKYNGKIPSITFRDGIDKETIGNMIQDFEENVNIPKKSIDPF